MVEPGPSVDLKDYYTVMVHFYRGELGRIMTWRQRLDVTTNWAILGTTGMITFGLGSPSNSHLIFMFANVLVFLLLTIEARRYRYYDAFRARVRMLESHFIMPVVLRDVTLLQGDWKAVLAEDLIRPGFKMSHRTAILRRYRRNYVWIFAIIAAAWFVKIWIHHPQSHTLSGFLQALRENNPIPSAIFLALTGCFYLLILFMTVRSAMMNAISDEFTRKKMNRLSWLE